MPQKLRCFVAIPIPDATIRHLRRIQEQLLPVLREMRWVAAENIHLTLAFLGNIDVSRVPDVAGRMDAAAAPVPSFGLWLNGVGVFPNRRHARVLWVGLDGALDRLTALQASLACGLESVGFSVAAAEFRAHLTIGRTRRRIDHRKLGAVLDSLQDVASEEFQVARLMLYQSMLKSGGAEYRPLHAAHLTT